MIIMATQKQVTELARELIKNLPSLTKPRTYLIAYAVLSIVQVCSISLVQIAMGMATCCKYSSNYRRLQRFIDQIDWPTNELMRLIVKWANIDGPFTLLIDRTNWQFGQSKINILCISILCDGYSVPIAWRLLDKKGNSRQDERIKLLGSIIDTFGADQIDWLVADREFHGEHWLNYLNNNNIKFAIRLCKTRKVKRYGRARCVVSTISSNKRNKQHTDGLHYWLDGIQVYIYGFRIRNDKGKLEYLIVVSQSKNADIISLYAERWYIENMFKDMKSNGLNITDTHVYNLKRLHCLVGLIILAQAWIIRIGQYVRKSHPKLFKKAKHRRNRKSVFRGGLDAMKRAFFTNQKHLIWKYIRFLSCT